MTGTIITVATMKGGSGKSTVASCLAVYWHLNGRRPVLIDADPQRSIMRVAERERGLGGVTIVEDATLEAAATARRFSHSGSTLIIDTPGIPLGDNAGLSGSLELCSRSSQGVAARRRPDA